MSSVGDQDRAASDGAAGEPRSFGGDGAGGGVPWSGGGEAGLASRVASGLNWMVLASVLAKAGSLIAQVVLGWLLSDEDYGVYAAAIGMSAFAQFLRDGGARNLLVQRGTRGYARLSGPVFWIAMACNTAGAALLLAIGFAIGATVGESSSALADPMFPWVLGVIGLALPLSTPGAVYQAKLSIDLRFRELAQVRVMDALVRYATMIGLALGGFGPLSFVIPICVGSAMQSVYGWWLCRDAPWFAGVKWRAWPAIFGRVKWLLLGALALGAFQQGDKLALGLVLPAAVLGVYFFGFQLALQINQLIGNNLRMVLFPALNKLVDAPERFRSAALRATRLLGLVGSVAGVGLAVIADPFIGVVWQGKWDEAVLATQVMSGFFAFRLLFNIFHSTLMARGQFARLAWHCGLLSVGLMAAGVLAAVWFGTAEAVAAAIGAYFAVGVTLALAASVRDVGVTLRDIVVAVLPPWLVSLAVGGLVIAFDEFVLVGRVHDVMRLLVTPTVFGVVVVAAFRVGWPVLLGEAVSVAPRRFGKPLRRALGLRALESPGEGVSGRAER